MLDEREGDVAASEVDRAFNRKSVWARIAIVIAGPLANLILAVLVYWLIFIVGGLLDGIVSGGGEVDITVNTSEGSQASRKLVLAKELLNQEGDVVGSIGLNRWWPDVDPVIGGVVPGGAAEGAGLQVGDTVLSSDGSTIDTWRELVEIIRASADKTLNLVILRGNSEIDLQLTPDLRESPEGDIGFIGARETQSQAVIDEKLRTVERYAPLTALSMGFSRTVEMISVSIKMIGKLLTGQASLKNTVSGPISIAQFAGQSVSVGIDHYLSFIALVSISLGIFNLFPVPMLDGGHLLYYTIELLTGKPVSDRIQIVGQQIGIALLGTLMIFVFYQDILRLFGG